MSRQLTLILTNVKFLDRQDYILALSQRTTKLCLPRKALYV